MKSVTTVRRHYVLCAFVTILKRYVRLHYVMLCYVMFFYVMCAIISAVVFDQKYFYVMLSATC